MYINDSASYITAYQAASASNFNLSVSGSYLEITGGMSGTYDVKDGVDVSDKARELLDRIKSLDVFKIIYPDSDPRKTTKTLGEVQNDFQGDFANFAGMFGQMTAMMGLGADQSFVMGLDGVGGMTVSGSDAASASKLQGSFNANSTMVSRFAVMAARAALVDAGASLDGFGEAYAQDPVAAIQNNIDGLKERLLGFRTVAGSGTMQYGFMRDFELDISASSAVGYGAAASV